MDGRYIFRRCVPDSTMTLGTVSPDEIIQREWTFRANMPPEVQEALDSGEFDPRNILHGSDGELYDGDGNFLAEVNTWSMTVDFTNTDYRPAGKKISWAIPTSYSVTITFTETVVRDAVLLNKIMPRLNARERGEDLNFQGVLRGVS